MPQRSRLAAALTAVVLAAVLAWHSAGAITDTDGRTRVDDRNELARLFADRTFYGSYADGSRFVEYYATDGRLGYWDGCPHSGQWRIAGPDDRPVACFLYPTMLPPGPHCFDVYRTTTRLEFLLAGTDASWPAHAWTREIRQGNPERLSLTASGCQISAREAEGGPARRGRG